MVKIPLWCMCILFNLKTICHKCSFMDTSLIYHCVNNILLMVICPKFVAFKILWLLFTTHYICPYLQKNIGKLSANSKMMWSPATTNCAIFSPLKPILWNGHNLYLEWYLIRFCTSNTCWIPPWSKYMTGLINPQCKILIFAYWLIFSEML